MPANPNSPKVEREMEPELPFLQFTDADRKQMGFHAVDAVILHKREEQLKSALAQLQAARDKVQSILPTAHDYGIPPGKFVYLASEVESWINGLKEALGV